MNDVQSLTKESLTICGQNDVRMPETKLFFGTYLENSVLRAGAHQDQLVVPEIVDFFTDALFRNSFWRDTAEVLLVVKPYFKGKRARSWQMMDFVKSYSEAEVLRSVVKRPVDQSFAWGASNAD